MSRRELFSKFLENLKFDAKPAEIRALFSNQLHPSRTAEQRDRMLAMGLPI